MESTTTQAAGPEPFPSHPEDRRLKQIALVAAVAIHGLVLGIRFPEHTVPEPVRPTGPTIVVKRYVPPPPRIEERRVQRRERVRRIPIPDPTPFEPEPIREPPAVVPPDVPFDPDVELAIGTPEAPPSSGIALAGAGGVSLPRLIPESKVEPDFPEAARIARVEGHVILQAVIRKDGTVGDLELLRCDRPDLGFEESAMAAVRQWRYDPARLNGRPVDVFFTVFVSFDLL